MNFIKLIIITILLLFNSVSAQNITISDITNSRANLISNLNNSNEYFVNNSGSDPSFQAKDNSLDIEFRGNNATIKLYSYSEFKSLINMISINMKFKYKVCHSYNEPIVYNYEDYRGNRIRFNYDNQRINIEFPSGVRDMQDRNRSRLNLIYVCTSDDSYAFHTNLRCNGLGNCKYKVQNTSKNNAKKYGYRICEICTNN